MNKDGVDPLGVNAEAAISIVSSVVDGHAFEGHRKEFHAHTKEDFASIITDMLVHPSTRGFSNQRGSILYVYNEFNKTPFLALSLNRDAYRRRGGEKYGAGSFYSVNNSPDKIKDYKVTRYSEGSISGPGIEAKSLRETLSMIARFTNIELNEEKARKHIKDKPLTSHINEPETQNIYNWIRANLEEKADKKKVRINFNETDILNRIHLEKNLVDNKHSTVPATPSMHTFNSHTPEETIEKIYNPVGPDHDKKPIT